MGTWQLPWPVALQGKWFAIQLNLVIFCLVYLRHVTTPPSVSQALSSDSGSVSVSWVPPLGIAASDGGGSICAYCLPDYALLQYADKAWSPNSTNTYGNWATAQATGQSPHSYILPADLCVKKRNENVVLVKDGGRWRS